VRILLLAIPGPNLAHRTKLLLQQPSNYIDVSPFNCAMYGIRYLSIPVASLHRKWVSKVDVPRSIETNRVLVATVKKSFLESSADCIAALADSHS